MKQFTILLFLILSFVYNVRSQSYIYLILSNQELVLADIENCSTTSIGICNRYIADIAICPNGNMYGTNGDSLYQISTIDASITPVGKCGTSLGLNSLVCDKNNTLYSVSGYAPLGTLYQISATTGLAINLGNTGFPSAGDLTFWDNTLFLTGQGNKLVKVDVLNPPNSQLVGVITNTAAVFGAVTVEKESCANNQKRMIANAGFDILELDTTDASTVLLCDDIVSSYIFGATSKAESNTLDCDTISIIEMPNVFSPNGDAINSHFKPVVFKNITNPQLTIYNRWGIKVASVSNLDDGWGGNTTSGLACTEGTYYWVLNYSDEKKEKKELKGFVTLVR